MSKHLLLLSGCCLLLPGCNSGADQSTAPVMHAMNEISRLHQNERLDQTQEGMPQSGKFTVEIVTSVGRFVVEVNREWAPIGADRFYQLVNDKYYDDSAFFRVVPGFVAQFGLAADPEMTEKWSINLQDEPVVQGNKRGYLTFAKAGPNTRTTQLFINLEDNGRLDSMGFPAFGHVIEGMEAVGQISSEHGEEPDQGSITSSGNAYLSNNFPNLTYIQTARILEDDLAEAEETAAEADVE